MMPNRLRRQLGNAWKLIAHSLSGRLLLLTILYVMVSEVLIFVPSIGHYYRSLLDNRIETAEIAILPFTELRGGQLSAGLRRALLIRAGASAVMLKRADLHELYLVDEMPEHVDLAIDLRRSGMFDGMARALDCLFEGDDRTLLVLAPTRIANAETIEVIVAEGPIRARIIAFARRLVLEALAISLVTALLVFLSLYLVVVRPMARLMRAMIAFRANPEDPSRIVMASNRRDEIGRAERELASMQGDLYGFLRQKARLAALGTAVAKIQHDLRNILASAQLASDRLAKIDDPVVQRLAPRLVASLDHAVSLTTNTLRYGRADEHTPERRRIALAPLIDEAVEASLATEAGERTIIVSNSVDRALEIDADPEQLYRIVLNLVRNAAQVLSGRLDAAITITAQRETRQVRIDIADNGPGIPDGVRECLFQPFIISGRPGGSGLGLAIARDLARAHGGTVTLVATTATGTLFRIIIPDRRE